MRVTGIVPTSESQTSLVATQTVAQPVAGVGNFWQGTMTPCWHRLFDMSCAAACRVSSKGRGER